MKGWTLALVCAWAGSVGAQELEAPELRGGEWVFQSTFGEGEPERVVLVQGDVDPETELWVPVPKEEFSEIATISPVGSMVRWGVEREGFGLEPSWLVGESADAIQIYAGFMNPLQWEFPKELTDGAQWQGSILVLSCGFMDLPVEYTATRETVEVPAGTFDAWRIERRDLDLQVEAV